MLEEVFEEDDDLEEDSFVEAELLELLSFAGSALAVAFADEALLFAWLSDVSSVEAALVLTLVAFAVAASFAGDFAGAFSLGVAATLGAGVAVALGVPVERTVAVEAVWVRAVAEDLPLRR